LARPALPNLPGFAAAEQKQKIVAEFVRSSQLGAIKLLNRLIGSHPEAYAAGCR
jgi:hypothetical protein